MVIVKAKNMESAKNKYTIPRSYRATGYSIKTVKKIKDGVYEVDVRKRGKK